MFNSCNLAWWHTYKQAANTIWKTFANDVFAPLWHHLYPGHTFYLKPGSFVCVLAHLLYLQLSREHIIGELNRLLADDNLSLQSRLMLKDLFYLIEVAIPVVPSSRLPFSDENIIQ